MKWHVVSPKNNIFGSRIAKMFGLGHSEFIDTDYYDGVLILEMNGDFREAARKLADYPKICCWTGSDARAVIKSDEDVDFKNTIHVTDTPWLISALRQKIDDVWFLPLPYDLPMDKMDYPSEPGILFYMTEHPSRDNERAKALIQHIRDIPIYVMRGMGRPVITPGFQDNVIAVESIADEERLEIFKKISAYVRPMKQDGLSMTVIEMKVLGRHVFYSIPAPYCNLIAPDDSIERIADAIREKIGESPDLEESEFYRRMHSKENFLRTIMHLCSEKGWKFEINSFSHPLVSFVVSSHNKERWIRDCLQSIVNQRYRPIEIIVCDNGSDDGSREIIKSFERFPWIHAIYHPDALGPSGAFNMAISKASGEYVIKLDADDVDQSNHVDLMMRVAHANPDAGMIFGDFEIIDGAGKVCSYSSIENGLETIFSICSISHGASMVRRSVYEEIGGYDESIEVAVDWEWIVRFLKAGKKAVYAGRTGHQWRRDHDIDCVTAKFGVDSEVRFKAHSKIFRKYKLVGSCGCECGAHGRREANEARESSLSFHNSTVL